MLYIYLCLLVNADKAVLSKSRPNRRIHGQTQRDRDVADNELS